VRIVYITAGAAGMYCGSCMHDNTLVSTLIAQGHDALLVPTYTPIRTDEPDVSTKRIFFGGVNVYLEQKVALFRRTPWFLDRLLNGRWLLNWVSRFAAKTRAEELGELALSMLRGQHGYQRKEIAKLLHWLEHEHRPELLNLTNVLLSGMVPVLKERLGIPILATLQGDDVFLDALPDKYRGPVIELVKEHCRAFDGFIVTSADYADYMSGYLDIPRAKMDVVYPGLNLKGHDGARPNRAGKPFTIGYFARIAPEKGLHVLVDAFRAFKQMPGTEAARLRVSGWLGEHNRPYFEALQTKLKEWKLADHFEHVDSPDLASKVRFFQEADVISVPAVFREPKGLYVLEALANGVPVVQPRHGSFPELIEATSGGLLVQPENPDDLACGLHQLLTNPEQRTELGHRGQAAVREQFDAEHMAQATIEIYRKYQR
jgi:glycosyltransferase involved in cell wall biosynthesis